MNLNQFCKLHKIDLSISYEKDKDNNRIMVEVIAVCRVTKQRILYRYDKYPRCDDDLLSELKEIVRERKIMEILL